MAQTAFLLLLFLDRTASTTVSTDAVTDSVAAGAAINRQSKGFLRRGHKSDRSQNYDNYMQIIDRLFTKTGVGYWRQSPSDVADRA